MFSHRYPSLVLIAFLFVAAVSTGTRAFAQACPINTVAITPATRQAATDAGIPASAQCWQPQDTNTGQAVGDAKQYLISLYTSPGNCSQKGLANPRIDGIQKLDAQFAVNLAAMLKAAPMKININSAFRTQEAQQCANPKVKSSNHSRGCAVDLGYSQNSCNNAACQWIQANASRYKLQIRMRYAPEWNHIEPLSCAGKSTGSVVTTGTYEDTEDADQVLYPIVPSAPSNPYGSMLQNPYSPAPTFPGAPPVTTTPPISTPTTPTAGVCTPQFSCSNSVMYYQTTSCTTQVYQNCTGGCNGNSCAVITPSTGTSTLVASTTTPHASSTEELLNSLSNPVSITAAPIGTASPIALALNNSTSHDVTQITVAGSTTTIVNPGTIASIQPLTAQQTFTTSDLSGSNSYSYNTQSISGASKILSDLKQALNWALSFLTGHKSS